MTSKTKAPAKRVASKASNTKPGTSEVRTLIRQANAAQVAFGKADRKARITGAKATHAVYEAGLIGKSRDGKYGWDVAADYAAVIGRKRSDLAGLRSIGVALSVGFDPDGEDSARWGTLSQRAASKEVTAVTTKASRPNLADIRATLDAVAKTTRNPGKGDKARAGKGADKARGKKADEIKMPRGNSARLDLIEKCVASMSPLTPAEAKRVASIVDALGSVKTKAADKAA